MMDMRSHVCWHVYGLLYRSTRDYPEAIKAYKQALRIDPENLQILRDLSLLQIQMRDLMGFRETRLKILTLRPNSKVHWLSYALGVHVCGDPEGAIGVLDSYVGTLEEGSTEFCRGFESSELALYKNRVLSEIREVGNELVGVKKALEHLEEIRDVVVDRTGWLQAKLSYQLQLGMFCEARDTCFLLFQRGCTEDHRVHGAYMCALVNCDRDTCVQVQKLRGTGTLATLRPLTDTERKILIDAYEDSAKDCDGSHIQNGAPYDVHDGEGATKKNLAARFPRSAAIKRIYLTLLSPSSEQFRTSIDKYCQRQLIKGVPSLGSDLSAMYLVEKSNGNVGYDRIHYVLATDPADVKLHPVYQQLVQLTDSYIHSLSSQNTFPNDSTEHPPSTLLWAWYLRSILHEQAAEYANGITLINKCIEHTPTGVDFYELKARLLEAGGDIQQAADVVDAGRDLDHQDRYINNQTTKTLLRAGREEDAKKRIAMFAIHEGDPEQNLYDMQCTWFELELADSCRRKGQLGRSLRKYMSVVKHYEDYHEDQFDFHAYCIRKVTLRTYCELLKFEDEIWGLPFYGHAAEEIVKIYLHILDTPIQSNDDDEPDYSKMTSAERKKAKNIARKKKKSQEKSDINGCKKSEDSSKPTDDNRKKGKRHPVNEDPNGLELIALDPTTEAKKFAAILVRHAPKNISSWALQYDVSIRRGKMLMALQALCKIKHIDGNSHQLFARTVDFSLKLASTATKGHPTSEMVISTEFSKLLNNQSLEGYIQSAFKTVKAVPMSSLPLRVEVAKAMVSAHIGTSDDALSLILDSELVGRGVTVNSCREALQFIESVGPDSAGLKEQWKMLVTAKFPFVKDL
ncbi:hypothetical protein HJC23_007725 [Cyclotella cryptica]|uniref:Uncharacterized protein n=1 Tax=Cyclotella cryptica TaxID=29204 RepID=A0ABD3PBL1_9STRA|eukprot:CCRYP_016410-RA/>CCRYP_016410-RA protein AED:0.04 eAED:0.04 QI:685/1/1/1/0.75/0.6/5/394/853